MQRSCSSWRCWPHPCPLPEGEGAKTAARSSGADQPKAERSDGPNGLHPLLAVPRSAGRGAGAAKHALRELTRCRCLSVESEANKASSAAPPHARASQVAPQGTRPAGPPFLCLLSFGGTKESRSPAGANSRPTASPTPHDANKLIASHAGGSSARGRFGLKQQAT